MGCEQPIGRTVTEGEAQSVATYHRHTGCVARKSAQRSLALVERNAGSRQQPGERSRPGTDFHEATGRQRPKGLLDSCRLDCNLMLGGLDSQPRPVSHSICQPGNPLFHPAVVVLPEARLRPSPIPAGTHESMIAPTGDLRMPIVMLMPAVIVVFVGAATHHPQH